MFARPRRRVRDFVGERVVIWDSRKCEARWT